MNEKQIELQNYIDLLIKESVTNDDIDWDWYEVRDNIESQELLPDLQTMKETGKQLYQPWEVIKFQKLKRVWEYYAKHGFVREEKLIDEFESIIRRNVAKLDLNTEYCGHGSHYPDEDRLEDYGLSIADIDGTNREMDELTYNYFEDRKIGQLRISDYAIPKLAKLVDKMRRTNKYDEKLVLIDQVLNIVHQRSDLASWFVEGGSRSLSQLSDTEKHDFPEN